MEPLPLLTAGLPGIGGILKQTPADFRVEEIPAYLPTGEGEFLYLWVEKRELAGEQLVSHLARELAISHQDIGMAGLKDRHAITRQWVSVPAKCQPSVEGFSHPQITILASERHRNKLRTGHLRGNRFEVIVRDTRPEAEPHARAIAAAIANSGFPNYFGDQRFGRQAETLTLGFELLRGEKTPQDIPRARRKFLLRLALSAVQSQLFNELLARRIHSGTLTTIRAGEVMQVRESGGPFVVDDPATDQARFERREIVPTGPLFGPKMKAPQGEPAEWEQAILAASGLTASHFEKFANLTSGTRRPLLVWPGDLSVEALADPSPSPSAGQSLRLTFSLPSGCYATVLLQEFQK